MKAVIISGCSGAGKSTALRTLEDDGFYCIDHLPLELIGHAATYISSKDTSAGDKIAINIDARNFHKDYPQRFSGFISGLKDADTEVILIFIEANNETIIRRYRESRRPHPFSNVKKSIEEAIEFEREQLNEIARQADKVITTDSLTPYQLNSMIREICNIADKTFVLIQSFAYKKGVPPNSNYVFDLRGLPNPYWIPKFRELTGRDDEVAEYLDQQPDCRKLLEDIYQHLDEWLPQLTHHSQRNLVISLGCTGGRHRSVYMAELLYEKLKDRQDYTISKKHLEIP